MSKANVKDWLLEAEKEIGETILSMVVGPHDQAGWNAAPLPDENVLISREAGLAKVNAVFDDGYGGHDTWPLWAWTENWLFFISCYDGSTKLCHIPRHPTAGKPYFPGGY